MKLSNKTYDVLKFIAVIILPIGEFITSISTIWGLPYGTQIVATLAAVHTLLGALIKTSSDNYAKYLQGSEEDSSEDSEEVQ